MRKIIFASELYNYDGKSTYNYYGEGIIGIFELLWTTVANSPLGIRQGESPLSRKEHKIIKGLKKKLKAISTFKDEDKNSRILTYGESNQELWLENDEYSLLIRLIEANNISSKVSDTYTDLMDLLDSSKEETLEPPKLI